MRTFGFECPMDAVDRNAPLFMENENDSPIPASGQSQPVRVLIVDDNVDAADTLSDLLHLDGYRTQVCYGEQQALDATRDDPPQIVIVDIGMPERGGHVLAQQIRTLLPDALLIAFTGFSRSEDIERSLKSGIDEHWVKPMNAVAFSHALGTAWARHARMRC
jgi:two-component system, sensor histidine kinase